MKKMFYLFSLLLVLHPMAAIAEDQKCGITEYLSQLRQISDRVIFDDSMEVDKRLLFFHFPPHVAIEDGGTVSFEVLLDGTTWLREELTLLPLNATPFDHPTTPSKPADKVSDMGGTAVELLSRHPEKIETLYALAMAGESLEVAIEVDSEPYATLSFADLTRINEPLKKAMPAPRVVESELTHDLLVQNPAIELPYTGEFFEKDAACENQCEDQFDDCIAYQCNYTWCSGCQYDLEDCMEDCNGGGGCTPNTTTVVNTRTISTAGSGQTACLWLPPTYNFSSTFEWTRYLFKNTEKEITTNADCSTSQTVTRVWYTYVDCWLDYFPPFCDNPRYGPLCSQVLPQLP